MNLARIVRFFERVLQCAGERANHSAGRRFESRLCERKAEHEMLNLMFNGKRNDGLQKLFRIGFAPSSIGAHKVTVFRCRDTSSRATVVEAEIRYVGFHLMLQPTLGSWSPAIGLCCERAWMAARRSFPVTGLPFFGVLSSKRPR